MFALVVVQKRGAEGLRLISIIGDRKFVAGMQRMMGHLHELDFAVDKHALAGALKNVRTALPNQDDSRLGAQKMAMWAGLDVIYDKSYESLNAYAHFDLQHLHAFATDNFHSKSSRAKQRAIVVMELQRIKDHTGEIFDYGLPLNVVTTQPSPGITKERVLETLKPTIYWQEQMIQMGEVVIATPA